MVPDHLTFPLCNLMGALKLAFQNRIFPDPTGSLGIALWVGILVALLFVPMAHGASPQHVKVTGKVTKKTLDSVKLRLEKGPNQDMVAMNLSRSKEPAYVPLLAEAFAESKNDTAKLYFSYALVRLGEKDSVYSNFMQRRGAEILKANIPYARTIEDNRLGGYSKAFLEWCRQNKMDTTQAERLAGFRYPTDFMLLGSAADPRNADILLRGLHASNMLIAAISAKGLARLGEPGFAKPIIVAIESRPVQDRLLMAMALVYFDSPEARRTAEMYIHPKEFLDALRKEREKTGLKGLFGS